MGVYSPIWKTTANEPTDLFDFFRFVEFKGRGNNILKLGLVLSMVIC